MSFAATLALVAAYEGLAERADRRIILTDGGNHGVLSRVRLSAGSLFLTSLIAGLATTPFAIYHFQRAAPLSLIANLAAMPVVGVVVMPMALFAVVLMPFGLEALPLTIMSYGLDWMMLVANTTAAWSAGLGRHQHGAGDLSPSLCRGIPLALPLARTMALCRDRSDAPGNSDRAFCSDAQTSLSLPMARPSRSGQPTASIASSVGQNHRFDVENWLRADGDDASRRERSKPMHAATSSAAFSRLARPASWWP